MRGTPPTLPGVIPPRLRTTIGDGTPAKRLADRFAAAGHEFYLVGGSVRDALLGRDDGDRDLDFTTTARPDEIKEIVDGLGPVFTVGEAFGTIGLIVDEVVLEITTLRSEVYRDDSRKPHVSFSDSIDEDLSRRDFTVNAIALRIDDPLTIDPFGGLDDLARRVLRTPMGPDISFSDDPLRMLRLFRFVSQLGFEPTEAAVAAVGELAPRLEIISAERIRDEFAKLVVGDHVADALVGLVESGLADHFIPELPALAMETDPHHHHKDVLAHSIAVTAKTSPRTVLRLAALLHDIGKPETREFGPDGGVTFHHHEVVGARMARARLKALRFNRDVVSDVGQLVFLHMRPHTFKQGWTDSAVRRYIRDAGPLLDDLNELVRCDVTTRNANRAARIQRRIDEMERRIEEVSAAEEVASMRPPIDGTQVMAYLGIGPSRQVGEVVRLLTEHRIDRGPYEEDEAYRLIDGWATDRGLEVPDPAARPESTKRDEEE
jgi:poly(A) polymerase